ncbi:MAG: fused DSP-PTPase phosphatase/NAD kinase-like protein [Pyrinomonadaceae bacterium]
MSQTISRSRFAAALFALLTLSFVSFAQTSPDERALYPQVKIKNFGQMDERFFRGAQPKEADYQSLAAIGIKTILDLREDAEVYAKSAAEAAGLRYVNIPMRGKTYPKEQDIAAFLQAVNDPETGKFYAHCAGGRHRTGSVGAVYRFNLNGWNYDQVYREMKNYDFYTRWGHGDYKKFVQDYWQRVQTHQIAPAATTTTVEAAASGGTK